MAKVGGGGGEYGPSQMLGRLKKKKGPEVITPTEAARRRATAARPQAVNRHTGPVPRSGVKLDPSQIDDRRQSQNVPTISKPKKPGWWAPKKVENPSPHDIARAPRAYTSYAKPKVPKPAKPVVKPVSRPKKQR